MATTTIKKDVSIDVTSSIDLSSISPVEAGIQSKAYKVGNIVMLSVVGTFANAQSLRFATIPLNLRPPAFVCTGYLYFTATDGIVKVLPAYINPSNGGLYIDAAINNNSPVRGFFMWTI